MSEHKPSEDDLYWSDEEEEPLERLWYAKKRARELYELFKTYSSKGFLDQLTYDDVIHTFYPNEADYEEF